MPELHGQGSADHRLKKVLIITYYWPPGSGPGVQRWVKFSKYLPEFGWQPIILTVKNGTFASEDPTLQEDIPAVVKVFRARTLEPFQLFNLLRGNKSHQVETAIETEPHPGGFFAKVAKFIRANVFLPDARVGWNFFALRRAQSIIRSEQPDLIITSGPPHSTHLIGLRLKQEFGLPWLTDFRDPWTTSYSYGFLPTSGLAHQRNVSLENKVLENATAIITVGKSMQKEYARFNPSVTTIHNGFDEDDLPVGPIQNMNRNTFSLAYVGGLKPSQNVVSLWQVICSLREQDPEFRKRFRLEVTGSIAPSVRASIANAGLKDCLIDNGFVSHKEAVKRMVSADLLLLPIPNAPNNRVILTGKLSEYLASGRPILAIGPVDGDASEVLRSCKAPKMIDYSDSSAMRSRLIDAFRNHNGAVQLAVQTLEGLSRKDTTKQLVGILNQISRKL